MSAVSSPARFWMQIVGPQVQKLDKLVDEMTEYYTNADNKELHKVGSVVFPWVLLSEYRLINTSAFLVYSCLMSKWDNLWQLSTGMMASGTERRSVQSISFSSCLIK